jgi:TP901 family phage tail tape measure protein
MAVAGGIRAGRAYVEVGAVTTKLFAGLRGAEDRVRAFGNAVQSVGGILAKIGVTAGAGFVLSGQKFADYESAMARVKAITNASAEEFALLGALAKKLGADTVFSAAQAAQAMGNFAQAGFSVQEIMQAVGPTLDLAATAQIEIADAASIAAKVMRGMGIEASKLAGVVDVMAKAATTANTDITMLGEAFKFVGPVARTANIGLEEITAAIQVLSDAGIQGEMAGTTLRGMILSLTSPTDVAAQALDELGIKVNDAQGNFLGLTSIVGQLQKAIGGLGNGAKLEVLGRIFPDRQAAGAAVLAAEGAERLTKATKALGNSTGTAARVAGTQMDTLRGTVDVLMSSIEGIAIELGQAVTPLVRQWGERLAFTANIIANLIRDNQEFAIAVLKGVVAVTAAGAALIATGIGFKVVAFGIGTVTALVSALLSPLGLITAGLIGLGAVLISTGDGFAALSQRFNDTLSGMANALKGGDIALAGQILWASLKVEWLTGVTALKSIWADLGVALTQGFADVSTKIASVMIDLWANLKTVWTQAINGLVGSWGNAIKTMFKAISPLSDVLLELFGIDVAKAADNLDWLLGIGPGAADLQKQQQDQLSAIESDRQTAQQQLQSQANTDFQTRRDNAQAGVASSAAELQAAKDDLNSKLGLAASKVPVSSGSGTYTPPVPGAAAAKTPLTPAGIDKTLERAQRTVETKGTFSAAAIRSLSQGDSVIDAVKEGTKEAKKQTDETVKMRRTVEQAGRLA